MVHDFVTSFKIISSYDKNASIRFQKKLDPELGRFTRQHIHGEVVMDVFKNIGSKIFGQTVKKAAKTAASKAVTTAATKTGEHLGKQAGNKIIQMLSKNPSGEKKAGYRIFQKLSKEPKPTIAKSMPNIISPGDLVIDQITIKPKPKKRMTQQEINQRLNFIFSDD